MQGVLHQVLINVLLYRHHCPASLHTTEEGLLDLIDHLSTTTLHLSRIHIITNELTVPSVSSHIDASGTGVCITDDIARPSKEKSKGIQHHRVVIGVDRRNDVFVSVLH